MQNKVWYFTDQGHKSSHHATVFREGNIMHYAKIQRAKTFELYNIWHRCLAHAGKTYMVDISKMTTGTPTLKSKYNFLAARVVTKAKL